MSTPAPPGGIPIPTVVKKCIVCNSEGKYRCSLCHAIDYCSRGCQEFHHPVHRNFCKSAIAFNNIPRLCEKCGKESMFGCTVCRMPYCSPVCYTADKNRHKMYCRPSPLNKQQTELIVKGLSLNMEKTYRLPVLKDGKTKLLIIQSDPSGVDYPSKNIFNIYTDNRKAIRETFSLVPTSLQAKHTLACLLEDYIIIMRMSAGRIAKVLLKNGDPEISKYANHMTTIWTDTSARLAKEMNTKISPIIYGLEAETVVYSFQELIAMLATQTIFRCNVHSSMKGPTMKTIDNKEVEIYPNGSCKEEYEKEHEELQNEHIANIAKLKEICNHYNPLFEMLAKDHGLKDASVIYGYLNNQAEGKA